MFRFIVLACAALLFAACTLQKRYYTKGYHVQGKRDRGDLPGAPRHNGVPFRKNALQASISEQDRVDTQVESAGWFCDTLILKNKKKIACRIVSQNPVAVQIRNCSGKPADLTEIPFDQIETMVRDSAWLDEPIALRQGEREETPGRNAAAMGGFVVVAIGTGMALYAPLAGLLIMLAGAILCVAGLKSRLRFFAVLGLILAAVLSAFGVLFLLFGSA